jgi:hypothetical protein
MTSIGGMAQQGVGGKHMLTDIGMAVLLSSVVVASMVGLARSMR